MFQYAKKMLEQEIKKEKEFEKNAKRNKEDMEEKLQKIKKYDKLKERIKMRRKAILSILVVFVIISYGLFYTSPLTFLETTIFTLSVNTILSLFCLGVFGTYKKYIKEYKKLSLEPINELREKEKSMEELCKKLENEIQNSRKKIHKYQKELKKISTIEKFQSTYAQNLSFYLADTKEEYQGLVELAQEKEELSFTSFLNEKTDYKNVHLKVQVIDQDVKCLRKK